MNALAIFNSENIPEEELSSYRQRKAVRIVAIDVEDNIALLHITKEGFYELPGGGVDAGETFEQAAVRECGEEIGCIVEIIADLGITLEYRKKHSLINESHGYTARVIGEKGSPMLVGDENDNEKSAVVTWLPLSVAIERMENTPIPENIYDQNCTLRDLSFLRQAQQSLTF